uniref:isoleucine--tRNA ligase n=1 Tax=Mimivirus LCMiAC01 TaxID=2506608 RepID=A0A481Z180_9VIRU|nr:MAG: isoleucyl-tRNA synthetase [Mimivirus LCMiAC01]
MSLIEPKDKFSFTSEESRILKFWKDNNVYSKLMEQNKDGPFYRFMDGPPFPSSKSLHHGHGLIAFLKDTTLRFRRMQGDNVLNKMGYDTHGLPIEMAVNKILGINTKQEIYEMGIDKYIQKCKETIESFTGAWEPIYEKFGRWVDFSNEYKTLDTPYMESVWWVFKELWKKKLIYRGYKVMPFSTKCATSLSNFEAGQNYKDVTDLSVFVTFPLKNDKDNTSIIAWTTTPWTLPSNLALCVHPDITYIKFQDKENGQYYIIAKNTIANIYSKSKKKKKQDISNKYTVVEKMKGNELKGLEYEPLFDYYKKSSGKFIIITDKYVTDSDGTGIVHQAPAHGVEDFDVCIKNNIVTVKEIGDYCPINDDGNYTDAIYDMVGEYVLDCNKKIIKKIRKMGRLIKQQNHTHSYPHCWRTDTPLIYKAVSSFFVEVTALKDKLIENNKKINWIPKQLGSGRFHNWLNNVKDWGISRSRIFGTPIPVWVSDDGEEMMCIGSIDELVKEANLKKRPNDLHLDSIQHITIPSKMGKGDLKLNLDLLDCWFESGCVPYGQIHYPFENKDAFKNREYLSDFIAEGQDQTRGWFYTLLVLSTALFDKPAFKNVICAGMILADDGTKMSKSKNNFTHPMKVLEKYGSDAMRLYLISSPAANASTLKFDETNITKIITSKLIQFYNVYKFFLVQQIKFCNDEYKFDIDLYKKSSNSMDLWIISRVNNLANIIKDIMQEYKIYKTKYELFDFIEDLANWYVKFNRRRFKGQNCSLLDRSYALSTLYYVLLTFIKVCAPFMPFLTESMYQNLKVLLPLALGRKSRSDCGIPKQEQKLSVHMCKYPMFNNKIDSNILRKVKRLQEISSIVRTLRNKTPNSKSVRIALQMVTICYDDQAYINDIQELEEYMKEELNCINLRYTKQEGLVKYNIVPNNRALGKKYRKLSSKIKNEIAKISDDVLKEYIENKINNLIVIIEDKKYVLERDEINIVPEINANLKSTEMGLIDNGVLVIIDYKHTQEVKDLFTKRMFIRAVQEMRKEGGLQPWNKIKIYYDTKDIKLLSVLKKYKKDIETTLLYNIYPIDQKIDEEKLVISKSCVVDNINVTIVINYVI